MKAFFYIAYFLVGLVQFFAVWDGVKAFLGIGSFFGFIISLFITYIPIIGSLIGVYGATEVWDWSLTKSLILFFWYVPVYIFFALAGAISQR